MGLESFINTKIPIKSDKFSEIQQIGMLCGRPMAQRSSNRVSSFLFFKVSGRLTHTSFLGATGTPAWDF